MNIKSEYLRCCANIIDILKNISEHSPDGLMTTEAYLEHFKKEKELTEKGEFYPDGEDLLCVKVLYKQFTKDD